MAKHHDFTNKNGTTNYAATWSYMIYMKYLFFAGNKHWVLRSASWNGTGLWVLNHTQNTIFDKQTCCPNIQQNHAFWICWTKFGHHGSGYELASAFHFFKMTQNNNLKQWCLSINQRRVTHSRCGSQVLTFHKANEFHLVATHTITGMAIIGNHPNKIRKNIRFFDPKISQNQPTGLGPKCDLLDNFVRQFAGWSKPGQRTAEIYRGTGLKIQAGIDRQRLKSDPIWPNIIIICLNQTTIWIIKKFKFGVWGQEENITEQIWWATMFSNLHDWKKEYAPYTVWLVPRNTWDCSGRHLLCLVVSVLGPGDIGKHLWTSTQGNETTSVFFLVVSNCLCPFVVGHMGPNGSSGCGSDIFTLAFFWCGHWAHGLESTASHPKC